MAQINDIALGVLAFKGGFNLDGCPYLAGTESAENWIKGFMAASDRERILFGEFKLGQWAYFEGTDVKVVEVLPNGEYRIQLPNLTTVVVKKDQLGPAISHDPFSCDVPPYFNPGL